MAKFIVIAKMPPRQAILGTVPEKVVVEEWEGPSMDDAIAGVRVPLGGEVRIVPAEGAVTVVADVVNRVVR